jgi:hypothetical protein
VHPRRDAEGRDQRGGPQEAHPAGSLQRSWGSPTEPAAPQGPSDGCVGQRQAHAGPEKGLGRAHRAPLVAEAA